jgi:hypothetical protein
MSLPEISRRCLSCGAAVRAGSRFCPQCGKPLEADAPTSKEASLLEEAAPLEPPPAAEVWAPPTEKFAAFEQAAEADGPRADGSQAESAESATEAGAPDAREAQAAVEAGRPAEARRAADPVPPPVEAGAADAEVLDGADGAAASAVEGGRVARVREGTRARVGRMREEAIVVLEETPDDSGLRFVVAAAALFVLFLVLLFLSTTVMR